MLFRRTISPLSSNHCFAIYQKSDFNRSKSHLNSFTFHGVFLLTQDHIFCSDSYRGSVKFYRDTTQILWLLPPTQAINDDNDCQHILNGILTHIQFNLTNSNLNRKCSKGHINLDLPRNHVYPLRWDLIFNYMFVS